MKIIQGKYNQAIVYTDIIDASAEKQIKTMCNLEFLKDSKIRIMSDVHAGASCTIGTTMAIKDAVVPNFVGVDIGCGMEVVKIKQKELDLKQLDHFIYTNIPSGFDIRLKAHALAKTIDLSQLRCVKHVDIERAYKSLGTLGGGNHFIEVNRDKQDNLHIVIHSGSRHLGVEVAEYYQNQAYLTMNQISKKDIQQLINSLKSQGREKEIQSEIEKRKKSAHLESKELAYCTGQLLLDYLHDMKFTQQYAAINRKIMMNEILTAFNLEEIERFTTIHNYIDDQDMILRKGAVSAKENEKFIIPINMRDGSLICIGKGNEDWNYSAPHGAGRILSRNEARKKITLQEYEDSMKGIYSTSVTQDTIDESPMAYKKLEDIVNNIQDTVEIFDIIQPIYNFKAKDKRELL